MESKEEFKRELERLSELSKKRLLSSYGDGKLIMAEELKNLILCEVSSTFTEKEIAFSLNAITLVDSNGVEYILDGKELYKKELVEKYTLVTTNQP